MNKADFLPMLSAAWDATCRALAMDDTGTSTKIKTRAAGVIFLTPEGQTLMLERSPKGDHSGEWCFPGGTLEGDERPADAARREVVEEVGPVPEGELKQYHHSVSPEGVEYTTFIQGVDKPFKPKINDEHTQAIWRGLDNLPQPLHPGIKAMFSKGQGTDMSPEDWSGLKDGLMKFLSEEEQEPEHADDMFNEGKPPKSPNPKAKPTGTEGEEDADSDGAMDAEPPDELDYKEIEILKRKRRLNPTEKRRLEQLVKKVNDWTRERDKGKAKDCDLTQDAKLSQQEVDYGPGKAKSKCALCEYFYKEGPRSPPWPDPKCELVEDPIIPDGWCKLFTADAQSQVEVNTDHDGPWMSCMSKDGQTMYKNSNLPDYATIKGKQVDVAQVLLHHEVPEREEIYKLLGEFENEHERKPTVQEKKQFYLRAHNSQGTPPERTHVEETYGPGMWEAWSAWCRGEEAKIEKLAPKNPPKDADVKPIPHGHGDLEITMDAAKGEELVGKLVRFYENTLHGKKIHAGMVKRVLPDGRLEIKPQLGGYITLKPEELIAQDAKGTPEHKLEIEYDGDFNMAGFIRVLHELGGQGSSRTVIVDLDAGDAENPKFGWDGDGADKIQSATIDGVDILKQKGASDEALQLAMDRCIVASSGGPKYALDLAKESVREYDADGHLHVKRTPISKANICPYIGEEIPDYEQLGLEAKKVYYLLRHPDELEKAASTSNGKPFMRKHEPVSADDHKPYDVIGALGNEAEWEDPYLYNSLVVWPQEDIDKIESGDKVQISSGYRYTADMTSGTYKGEPFQGVMRNIIFNHAASVEEGRAGKDVRVLDSVNPNVGWAAIEAAILNLKEPA